MVSSNDRGVLDDLEQELTLLARHHISAAQHRPGLRLDRSGYQLLARLEHEPLSLGQLAAAFHLDVSTVNRQVAALRRNGLVERIADPAGGMAKVLRPTEDGLIALAHDRRIKRGDVRQVVRNWDPDDTDDLLRLLTRFNGSIEALEGRPWPRTGGRS